MKKFISLILAFILFIPMSVLSYNQNFDYKAGEARLNAICLKLTEANNVNPIKVVINYKSYVDIGYNGQDQISVSEGMYLYMQGDEGKLAYVLANTLVHVRPTTDTSPEAEYLLNEVFSFDPWIMEELHDTALAINYMIKAGYSKDLAFTYEVLYAYNPTVVGLMKTIFIPKYLKLIP